jgi:hypothetical protein
LSDEEAGEKIEIKIKTMDSSDLRVRVGCESKVKILKQKVKEVSEFE